LLFYISVLALGVILMEVDQFMVSNFEKKTYALITKNCKVDPQLD